MSQTIITKKKKKNGFGQTMNLTKNNELNLNISPNHLNYYAI